MRRMTVRAIAIALLVAIGAAGCGGEDDGSAVTSIALVAPGRGNDLDWTRQAREAFEAIAERRRLTGLIAEDVTAEQVPTAFGQLDDRGAELVFAHDPSYAQAAARAAADTGVPTLVWGDADAVEPGLVGDVEVAASDGGFLAGALSSHATGIKSVGILIADDGTAWDTRNWNLMAGGVIAGARHEIPHVRIELHWVGGPDGTTFEEMQSTAEDLLNRRVQTLFALGGRTALGVLKGVDKTIGEEEYAGVIGDKATVNTLSDVVTSVLYDFDGLFRRAIADVRAGRFGERPYTLTFENGGLSLLRTGRTPDDAYAAAMVAQREIADGTIEVPETPTRDAVRALLREPAG